MNKREAADLKLRAVLLKTARDLFGAQGFERVTMRDLARLASSSTGAIFHKWAGKEALFEDAMDRDWPDPAAFARFVLACGTVEQARAGAAAFLGDVAGKDQGGPVWKASGVAEAPEALQR